MKMPMVKECPCCEASVVETVKRHNEHDVLTGCEVMTGNIEPFCRQINDDGGMYCLDLFWRCNVCGCEWKHGQFGEAK